MGSNTVKTRSMQKSLESILQNALDLLEADDGKSFEEKKAAVIRMLTDKEDALLVNKLMDIAGTEKNASQVRETFWGFGEVIELPDEITLGKVSNERPQFVRTAQSKESVMSQLPRCLIPFEIGWVRRNTASGSSRPITLVKGCLKS